MHNPTRSFLLLLFALCIAGCGESIDRLNTLAAQGSIHESAPVKAHLEAHITAPPERIWALLTDASSWPQWAKQIESVSTPGPLQPGSSFTWKTGGSTVHSQVQVFKPRQRLAWTGTAFTAKAVHIWTLTPGPDASTTVTVDESMDGPLMDKLYPSAKLREADRNWLDALKQAAEQAPKSAK